MLPLVSFEARKDELPALFEREISFGPEIRERTREILDAVRDRGDAALRAMTARYDGVEIEEFAVPSERGSRALADLDDELRSVLREAAANIRRFHDEQRPRSWFVEEGEGVILGQRAVPLDRAGVYVPGGTAAYPSTVLMCVVPAQVAGVEEIHLVSPPGPSGRPHPHVLAAAALLEVEHVYAVGGAQAVGALAFGTETVPAVDKIVGPGNAYVAEAKRQVFGRVDIDSMAGPSEVVVLADGAADPRFVAADLIAQAEHDERASAVLVTPSDSLARAVGEEVTASVPDLERSSTVRAALSDYSARIVTSDLAEGIQVVNELAPEHLELMVEDPWSVMPEVDHAGAIFLGAYSTEPVGDYWAGPNHVLPTGGSARYASGLGVDDFVRSQSVIQYSERRLRRDGSKIERFAREEGLTGHARAVRARLDRISERESGSTLGT